jgi:hypothetical protein
LVIGGLVIGGLVIGHWLLVDWLLMVIGGHLSLWVGLAAVRQL